ncbi:DUF4433 domain-containing protein [Sinorhizobium meliloti]|uniref:type II toxin-antitoxin system toxin DNA ADP-ribosyl transferase DarT n=1 Tax=Sinorhizobium TaxID=28105 RepID=UPI000FDC27F8|nr:MULTISPECIES: DUF4433 domain-containing protein [Sinorhizobium]MQV98588.1 DUF4433 domain-containing protein [Sinorhizobium medicae]RVH81679.1 DUF4433 domain-containing protein [Sinorhizobium meliloti]RVM25142.1 DUF4433 domain-containing protein [Sinorhizobium meliloti]RVN99811.1 DUF4433 domain-containing protein [Sinorhizobium meliloti]
MTPPPSNPKIYHIVNVDKLQSIIAEKHLYSDSEVIRRALGGTVIGMSTIKRRRLELPVDCHEGITVGECVPFYFCSRSVMLYVIYRGDNPELLYKGGQAPIIHLEADLKKAVAWADNVKRCWAFTATNAGARYTEFWSGLHRLDEINWDSVRARQWSAPEIKEAKQAEFLVHKSFPWSLVDRIVVYNKTTFSAVAEAIHNAPHRPKLEIDPSWYY